MKTIRMTFIIYLLFIPIATFAAQETFVIDPVHSSVEFKIRHLVGKVKGEFTKFSGEIQMDEKKPEGASVKAEIATASITTNNDKRDAHLKGKDFFHVTKYPKMVFTSKRVAKKKDGAYLLKGSLSLHGVTKDVALNLTYNGKADDPWGNTRAGFTADGELNRKDFGINWNKTLDAGGVLIGDNVRIRLDIEAILQKHDTK